MNTPIGLAFLCAVFGCLAVLVPALAEDTHTITHGEASISMVFVNIGNPGNASDTTTGCGGVPYDYEIGKYEVSEGQFSAAGLARPTQQTSNSPVLQWGQGKPITCVSWFDAARYVNWLTSGSVDQGVYDTSNWKIVARGTAEMDTLIEKYGRVYFLPNDNEWYKSAYYDPKKDSGAGGWWDYATGSDVKPIAVAQGNDPGTAVYGAQPSPADVDKAGGLSPYGTMGQGGNVWEWTETEMGASAADQALQRSGRRIRGGSFCSLAETIYDGVRFPSRKLAQQQKPIAQSASTIGFRVASVSKK